jgi:hypothetical protein
MIAAIPMRSRRISTAIRVDFNEWLSLKEGYGVRSPFASFRFFRAAAYSRLSPVISKAEPQT